MALSLYSTWMDTAEAMDNTYSQLHLAIPGHLLAETQPLSLPLKNMYWAVGEYETLFQG